MFIVGLTGGIGSGKSTTAAYFEKYVNIINADEIARDIVKPNSSSLDAIASHFGSKAILQDATLNRRWLRDKIFSDPIERKWLENLLHPLIRAEIIHSLHKSQTPYCVLMSPLLLETDQHLLTNRILVIDAPESMQIERVSKRDETPKESVETIIKAQLSRYDRLKQADDIIINTGDVIHLKKAVHDLHNIYLKLATCS